MCTRARLVQGAQVSEWFGMPMNGPTFPTNIRLAGGQPAYLEVEIDPAAHDEAGLGPLMRGVVLQTASNQELQFELAGFIVR